MKSAETDTELNETTSEIIAQIPEQFDQSNIESLSDKLSHRVEIMPKQTFESNISDLSIEPKKRSVFIRQVFVLATIKFALSFAFVLIIKNKSITNFLIAKSKFSNYILFFALVLYFGFYFFLSCNLEYTRKSPQNLLILLLVAICEGIFCANVGIWYDFEVVFIIMCLTIFSMVGITIYNFQTIKDFSYIGTAIIVLFSQLLIGSLLLLYTNFKKLLYCYIGGAVAGTFLVYDSHLISGKFGLVYSTNDQIVGALGVYMEFVRLFLKALWYVKEYCKEPN